MSSSSEEVTVPGHKLGIIEEYVFGEGTYSDEEGNIRASVVGRPRYNKGFKHVEVVPVKRVLYPRQGSEVLGVVVNVHRDLVVVEVYAEVRTQPSFMLVGEYKGTYTAGIPLSQVSDEYVKDIYEYFRIGDVIVARVISRGSPLTLTTRGPNYGVIYAQCSRCGSPLVPISQKTMKCNKCGNVEKRKVSALAMPRPPSIRLKRLLLKTLS
jgi:exosome complex component CSL4